MPRISFVHSEFPNPDLSEAAVRGRLTEYWFSLIDSAPSDRDTAGTDHEPATSRELFAPRIVPRAVNRRINRRAKMISDRHSEATPMARLSLEDRQRLEGVRDGVSVENLSSEHRADEIAAALHDEFPWLQPATEKVWLSMRRSVRAGDLALRFGPVLLDGPPGVGKSAWARHLASLVSVPCMQVDATTESASFGIAGVQKAWGNSEPGKLLNLIITTKVGNPLIVIDEVEKAGAPRSRSGQVFSLAEALLPLLEPASAARWGCPYFRLEFDLGWVNWVLTANNSSLLPEPLLSRCPPIHIAPLTFEHFSGFVRRQARKRGLGDAARDAITEAIGWALQNDRRPDLRTANRMLDRAEIMESAPRCH